MAPVAESIDENLFLEYTHKHIWISLKGMMCLS
jgi:hypothetical protein